MIKRNSEKLSLTTVFLIALFVTLYLGVYPRGQQTFSDEYGWTLAEDYFGWPFSWITKKAYFLETSAAQTFIISGDEISVIMLLANIFILALFIMGFEYLVLYLQKRRKKRNQKD